MISDGLSPGEKWDNFLPQECIVFLPDSSTENAPIRALSIRMSGSVVSSERQAHLPQFKFVGTASLTAVLRGTEKSRAGRRDTSLHQYRRASQLDRGQKTQPPASASPRKIKLNPDCGLKGIAHIRKVRVSISPSADGCGHERSAPKPDYKGIYLGKRSFCDQGAARPFGS